MGTANPYPKEGAAMMVADAGLIISFARIGRLDLLRQVVEELAVRGRGRPGATEVEQGEWIYRRAVTNRASLALFPSSLSSGQREAIVLAQELGLQLLMDEGPARREALALRVEVLGSLRVLADAKRTGLIDQVKPLVEAMRSATYRIGDEVLQDFLEEMGEGDL
jgi:predicted nucleic acid-binding protein